MENHKSDLSMSCVWLSILSHSRGKDACKFVDEQTWGEVKSLFEMVNHLKAFGRKTKTTVFLWHVKDSEGFVQLEEKPLHLVYPGSLEKVHVAVIDMGAGYHMLPLAAPKLTAKVPLAKRPTSAPEQAPPVATPDDGSSSSATAVSTAPQEGQIDQGPVEDHDFEVIPAGGEEGPTDSNVGNSAFRGRPSFDGIHSPPGCLNWRRGWWPSTGTQHVSMLGLLPKLRPAVASATQPYAKAYLDSVLYLPVEIREPLFEARRRIVSDGQYSSHYFLAGDVVRAGDSTYRAEPVKQWGLDLLRLVRNKTTFSDCFSKAVRDLIPFVSSCPSVELATAGPLKLSDEGKSAAKWMMQVNTTAKPIAIASISQFRNRAAAKNYSAEADQPDEAGAWVEYMTGLYPEAKGVGGPYKWGYCFSCGKQLPGTFKHRLCKECNKGKNSDLGRIVAEGLHVTSASNPIVYPGVVNTVSRHPQLKPTSSFATPQNFRLAPSASRRCCPSLH
jgi:hypothetical protein